MCFFCQLNIICTSTNSEKKNWCSNTELLKHAFLVADQVFPTEKKTYNVYQFNGSLGHHKIKSF